MFIAFNGIMMALCVQATFNLLTWKWILFNLKTTKSFQL